MQSCEDTTLIDALSSLEHRQWTAIMEPWMKSVPLEDSDYSRLMKKTYEELTPEERAKYCSRWADEAAEIIEREARTTVNLTHRERLMQLEWRQTTEWVAFMFYFWTPDNLARWRIRAKMAYQDIPDEAKKISKLYARQCFEDATGLKRLID